MMMPLGDVEPLAHRRLVDAVSHRGLLGDKVVLEGFQQRLFKAVPTARNTGLDDFVQAAVDRKSVV